MNKKYQIFISSTYEDLKKERSKSSCNNIKSKSFSYRNGDV